LDFLVKILYRFFMSPCMLYVLPISSSLILSHYKYVVMSTNYETSHNDIFSSLLLLPLITKNILISLLFSDTYSLMFLLQNMWYSYSAFIVTVTTTKEFKDTTVPLPQYFHSSPLYYCGGKF
jgi:cytochrome c biogenesis protein CcdA